MQMTLNDYTLMLCAKIEKINISVLEFNELNYQDHNVWARAIVKMRKESNFQAPPYMKNYFKPK